MLKFNKITYIQNKIAYNINNINFSIMLDEIDLILIEDKIDEIWAKYDKDNSGVLEKEEGFNMICAEYPNLVKAYDQTGDNEENLKKAFA